MSHLICIIMLHKGSQRPPRLSQSLVCFSCWSAGVSWTTCHAMPERREEKRVFIHVDVVVVVCCCRVLSQLLVLINSDVCVCVWARKSKRVCVCVWEREKERERECVCVLVCVWERARACVCVRESERERESVWACERVCVCCEREREWVCVRMCVCWAGAWVEMISVQMCVSGICVCQWHWYRETFEHTRTHSCTHSWG